MENNWKSVPLEPNWYSRRHVLFIFHLFTYVKMQRGGVVIVWVWNLNESYLSLFTSLRSANVYGSFKMPFVFENGDETCILNIICHFSMFIFLKCPIVHHLLLHLCYSWYNSLSESLFFFKDCNGMCIQID